MWINQEVVATARGQIGYRPGGSTQGKFCDWFGRRANWCAMGTTWTFNETLGEALAKAVIGVQADAPNGRGWSWTVGLREWLQKNGTRIDIRACIVGDLLFFKYPTTGERDDQVVNHVEIVVGVNGNYITTVGFNTAEPRHVDTDANRGVYMVAYLVTNKRFVDAYRPAYDRYPGIGYIPNGRTVGEIQQIIAENQTGIYSETTRKGVERLQSNLNFHGFNLTVDGLWGWGTNAAFDEFMAQVQTFTLAGKDRYHTGAAITNAAWTPLNTEAVYLARGNSFPDALSIAGSLAPGSNLPRGPVLLVMDVLPDPVRAEIKRLKPTKVYRIGGSNVVPDAVLEEARSVAQSVQ